MPRYKVIRVGEPFSADVLSRRRSPRQPNPRDVEILKLLHEVSVGPESMVYPLDCGTTKQTTMRAVVVRLVRHNSLPVYVAVNAAFPNKILLSRTPIGRAARKA